MINYRQINKDDDNFFKNLISYEGKHYDDFLSIGWSKNQIINQIQWDKVPSNPIISEILDSQDNLNNLIPIKKY